MGYACYSQTLDFDTSCYKLMSIVEKSDFNYSMLQSEKINSRVDLLDSVFKPLTGDYKVYTFLLTYREPAYEVESYQNETKFVDAIIGSVQKLSITKKN